MKKIKLFLMAGLALLSLAASAQEKTDTLKVYGNCEMCKARIEKAATLEGVQKADWNTDTKILTVLYDAEKIKLDKIQKNIAASGHDTEKYRAEAAVYKKLPGCCQYERKPVVQSGATRKTTDPHTGHNH